MADFTLSVDILGDASHLSAMFRQARADVASFGSQVATGYGRATTAFGQMRTEVKGWSKDNQEQARLLARGVQVAGAGMVAGGAAVAAGFAVSARAAIDWESAFAGVVKTVGGTPAQIDELEESLRGLTRILPASHEEIAGVAEAAGQLGVAREDVVGFTKTMIDLGESTNLTSDEAATTLAQISNIMGTMARDGVEGVQRMGSALVALGNDGASTEQQIVSMALRIAGAGKTIGLTEAEVLAVSSALASAGVNAEAGGSSISSVMIRIADAVSAGGGKLQQFAQVSGMSAEQFTQSFKDTPAQAINAFVTGLGRIQSAGGDVFGTLGSLGIKQINMRDSLLRLAGAGDLLSSSLSTANTAWDANTALLAEAETRYQTTESRIQIARNSLQDTAISIGSMLLPALAGLADRTADVLQWLNDLPGPVKAILAAVAGLSAAALVLGGSFLLLAPKIVAARAALESFSKGAPRTTAAMTRIGASVGRFALKATAALAAIGLLVQGLGALAEATDVDLAPVGLNELDDTLTRIGRSGRDLWSEVFGQAGARARSLGKDVTDLDVALSRMFNRSAGDNYVAFVERFISWDGHIAETKKRWQEVDQALAQMVSAGRAAEAESSFNQIAAAAEKQGISMDKVNGLFTEYGDAMVGIKNDAARAAEGQLDLAAATDAAAYSAGVSTEEYKKAQDAIDKQREAWDKASTGFIDITGTYKDLLQQQQDKSKETAEATATAKGLEGDAWKDFVTNVKVSLTDYLAELDKQVKAQQNWQSNLLSLTGSLSAETIKYLTELGPEGADLVAQLTEASAGELRKFDTLTRKSLAGASGQWAQELEAGMALVQVVAERDGAKAAQALAQALADGKTTVEAAAADLGATMTESIPGQWDVTFAADTTPADTALADVLARVADASGTITIEGDPSTGLATVSGLTTSIDQTKGTVTIYGYDGSAVTTLSNYKAAIDETTGYVTISGDDSQGRKVVAQLRSMFDATGATIDVGADTASALNTVQATLQQVGAAKVNVNVGADGKDAWETVRDVTALIDSSTGTITILGDDGQAVTTLERFTKEVDKATGEVIITGNDTQGRQVTARLTSWIDEQKAAVRVNASTSAASTAVTTLVADINRAKPTIKVGVSTPAARPGQMVGQMADGGPVRGPGTGTSDSVLRRLSNGEHVWTAREVRGAGGHGQVAALRGLAALGRLGELVPGLAAGGAVGAAQRAQASAKKGVAKAKKLLASWKKRKVKNLEPAKKNLADWQERYRTATDNLNHLKEQATDLRRTIARGQVAGSASDSLSGAYGVVDQMRSLAADKSVNAATRKALNTAASSADARMRSLFKQSDTLAKRLDTAQARVDDLKATQEQVAAGLRQEQSLADYVGGRTEHGYTQTPTAAGIISGANARAAKIKAFAQALDQLQKLGMSGVVLQEIASLGSDNGLIVAQEFIRAGKTQVTALNAAYKSIDSWSNTAGKYVTGGFYQGGVDAAAGLVKGLQSQQAAIDKQITAVAKSMEKALKKALGIKSPSKVTQDVAADTGAGLVVGLARQERPAAKAAGALADAVSGAISAINAPVAPSVAAAVGGTGGGVTGTPGDMAAGLLGMPVTVEVTVGIDGPTAGRVTGVGLYELDRNGAPILRKVVAR